MLIFRYISMLWTWNSSFRKWCKRRCNIFSFGHELLCYQTSLLLWGCWQKTQDQLKMQKMIGSQYSTHSKDKLAFITPHTTQQQQPFIPCCECIMKTITGAKKQTISQLPHSGIVNSLLFPFLYFREFLLQKFVPLLLKTC